MKFTNERREMKRRREKKTHDGKRRYTIKYLIIMEKFIEEKRNKKKVQAGERESKRKIEKSGRMKKRHGRMRTGKITFISFISYEFRSAAT